LLLIDKLKAWNVKYDIWSFSSDFFFILGVLLFNWNPVLLILWFMVDTSTMIFFGIILFRKEGNDWVGTVGFIITSFIVVGLLACLYMGVEKFIIELKMEELINSDPSQIINPIVLPIVLSCSILSHHAQYVQELKRMKEGTYTGAYLKHFFLRYILISALIVFIVFFFVYFQIGIIIALIGVKAFLRFFNKKFRSIL